MGGRVDPRPIPRRGDRLADVEFDEPVRLARPRLSVLSTTGGRGGMAAPARTAPSSETSTPARISPPPAQPGTPRRSPNHRYEKNAAKTGSPAKMSAVRVGPTLGWHRSWIQVVPVVAMKAVRASAARRGAAGSKRGCSRIGAAIKATTAVAASCEKSRVPGACRLADRSTKTR